MQGAYPRLSDAQVAALTALGERRAAQPEEVLFREGQRNGDFFVVLAGNVAVVEARGTPEERTIAVHGRHRFLGELGLLTGEASYFTAVAVDAGVGATIAAGATGAGSEDSAPGTLPPSAPLTAAFAAVAAGTPLSSCLCCSCVDRITITTRRLAFLPCTVSLDWSGRCSP